MVEKVVFNEYYEKPFRLMKCLVFDFFETQEYIGNQLKALQENPLFTFAPALRRMSMHSMFPGRRKEQKIEIKGHEVQQIH